MMNLLIQIIARRYKLSSNSWVAIICSRKTPRTTILQFKWQRFGSISPSSDLLSDFTIKQNGNFYLSESVLKFPSFKGKIKMRAKSN